MGHRTTLGYDADNRVTQTKDALGDLTTTLYDPAGNVTTSIDARGNRTTMSYDADNRVTQTQDATGGIVTTVYDAAGNVAATVVPLTEIDVTFSQKSSRGNDSSLTAGVPAEREHHLRPPSHLVLVRSRHCPLPEGRVWAISPSARERLPAVAATARERS